VLPRKIVGSLCQKFIANHNHAAKSVHLGEHRLSPEFILMNFPGKKQSATPEKAVLSLIGYIVLHQGNQFFPTTQANAKVCFPFCTVSTLAIFLSHPDNLSKLCRLFFLWRKLMRLAFLTRFQQW
jgi:hypothetical protein